MGRLQNLRIDAYRSLRDLKIDQLGRMNLLVGGNNAGKTSVLEAVGLAARPFDPAQWVQTVTNRDASGPMVNGLWALFPSAQALNLEQGVETSEGINIRAVFSGNEERHLQAHAQASTEAYSDVSSPEAAAQTDIIVRIMIQVALTNPNNSLGHVMEFRSTPRRVSFGTGIPPLRAFVVTPVTHRSTQQLVVHLSHVIDQGKKAQCVELLRIFDPAVEDVEISRPLDREAIRIMHQRKGVVDLSTFGDGMRRAFAMSTALVRASGGLLLIDEIESAIHVRALGPVLSWLVQAAEEADVQLFATTHSIEAVDAMLEAFMGKPPESVTTFHLRRTDGKHVCRRYDLAGLKILREEGLDIR